MKIVAWIRKSIKKSMTWLWIGSIAIILSNVMQFVAPSYPSLPLATLGLALNTISVPFTIVQAYRSALEQQQLFEQERKARDAADRQVFSETPKGRTLGALSQLRKEMRMDS